MNTIVAGQRFGRLVVIEQVPERHSLRTETRGRACERESCTPDTNGLRSTQ